MNNEDEAGVAAAEEEAVAAAARDEQKLVSLRAVERQLKVLRVRPCSCCLSAALDPSSPPLSSVTAA